MEHNKQPYPSFALVMSTAIQYPPYSSRLPSYRSGHTERYHPYPRPSRSRETRLMNTVDYRYVDLPTWGSPPCTVRLRPVFSCVDSDVSTVDLGRTSPAASDLIGGDHCAEGRSKLAAALLALFLALRRKYLFLVAEKPLLPTRTND